MFPKYFSHPISHYPIIHTPLQQKLARVQVSVVIFARLWHNNNTNTGGAL